MHIFKFDIYAITKSLFFIWDKTVTWELYIIIHSKGTMSAFNLHGLLASFHIWKSLRYMSAIRYTFLLRRVNVFCQNLFLYLSISSSNAFFKMQKSIWLPYKKNPDVVYIAWTRLKLHACTIHLSRDIQIDKRVRCEFLSH